MKWALRIAGGLVALFVVIVAVAVVCSNFIIKGAIEREGTRSLRLTTSVDSAHLSLFGGKLALHGLAIASPPGFSAPQMMKVDDIVVDVGWTELRHEPIHIGSISIRKPVLVIEQAGGGLNFRKAMERMPKSDPGKEPMKLVIDELHIPGAEVIVRPGVPGLQQELTLNLPELTMKDIGRGRGANNGAALREVAMQVMTAIAAQAAKSSALPPEVRAVLQLNAAKTSPEALGKTLLEQFAPHR